MRNTRKGFTLVELLVVMSLIAILAIMAVLFFPNAVASQREAKAAQDLQGWLTIARQRALRDQAPRGLRLWITTTTVGPNNYANVVTDCQYIESPDDYRGGANSAGVTTQISIPWQNPLALNNPNYYPPPPNAIKSVFDVLQINADLTNGYGALMTYNIGAGIYPQSAKMTLLPPFYAVDPTQLYWTVQPCPFVGTNLAARPWVPNPQGFGGDYVEINGNGLMHQIIAVLDATAGPPATTTIQISPPLPTQSVSNVAPSLLNPPPFNPTTNFRIVRAPRPVGSEMLTLPDGTFIDLNTNAAYDNPLPNLGTVNANVAAAGEKEILQAAVGNSGTGFIDILFSPSGQVITPGLATSNLHLWVRAPSEDKPNALDPTPWNDPFLGEPTIVSVFARTGYTGAFPVAPPTVSGDPYFYVK